MNLRRTAALAGTALLLPLALTACGSGDDTAADGDRLQVLASFYPLQFVAQSVAGELADVDNLTPPAADPHDLELSPARAREISSADVVITLGGFQPAVDDAVAAREPAHLVDAADVVTLLPATVTGGEEEHDHADDDAHDDGYTHDGDAHDDHDHDLGGLDPHFWLDPTRLAQLAQPVADALSAADPDNAATFAANAAALVERLDDLDQELAAGLAPFAGATLITSHTAFGYLADRYGLAQVGVTGLDHDIEPSPARMREIGDLARRYGVTTLFSETLVSPRVIATLASDLGLRTAVLDTVEGLGQDDADAGEDYVSIMQRNLTALTEGLTAP
ncbi:periplasmic solute binding protein [Xylanimonas cellulosilytica DSM 15894]|uniref:Periplasmic solute binding protein n=1 Tax=Xylanimonas cellulosilytica (strain DSM 15894 / JCM 12276 / CECT 5975 / KCTC 9989 / LMG 20990 / NBRC 107835 / XIL07) TaxID=446471 RepID=D1BUH3_XYLCX|nr:zinc ABC transporter substrate-binding protein [Xylanimonas cellulosilytica]ACZ31186.1 periplasmic solute binding protein [Xylanimonas cellulosilytica DSM 15894]